jgi:hypothetical protein
MKSAQRRHVIYVAGPMRGYPNWNYHAFDSQTEALRKQGWQVVNPAEMDREFKEKYFDKHKISEPNTFDPMVNYHDQEFLRDVLSRDLEAIAKNCTAIYMMKGWEHSLGARAEWALAKALGLDIFYEIPLPISLKKP